MEWTPRRTSRASPDTVAFTFILPPNTHDDINFTITTLSFTSLIFHSGSLTYPIRQTFSSPTGLIPQTIWPLSAFSAHRLDLFAWCVRLSRLLVGFQTHLRNLRIVSYRISKTSLSRQSIALVLTTENKETEQHVHQKHRKDIRGIGFGAKCCN